MNFGTQMYFNPRNKSTSNLTFSALPLLPKEQFLIVHGNLEFCGFPPTHYFFPEKKFLKIQDYNVKTYLKRFSLKCTIGYGLAQRS